VKLPASAIDLITTFPLGFVATVTAGGRPNVSPKGTFLVLDDQTIAFGEIRSPQTVTNLTNQPELEVNFVDQWTRKGVRIRGKAQMVRRGTAEFGGLIEQWENIWGDLADRINLIVKIPVYQVKPLSTPPYDDGATEEDMIATYKAKFAEIYP
jgi:predicted pyridoxine 5'-phosphate oxidase superfamily flavin-nucleotide-binding protein